MTRSRDIRTWLPMLVMIVAVQLALYLLATAQAPVPLDPFAGMGSVTSQSHDRPAPDPLIDLTPAEVRSLGGPTLAEHLDAGPQVQGPMLPPTIQEALTTEVVAPESAQSVRSRSDRAPPAPRAHS